MARTLSIGITGDDVAGLQRVLNYHFGTTGADVPGLQQLLNYYSATNEYLPLAVDGIFGPITQSRVMIFQQLNQQYPVQMPIVPGNGVVSDPLAIDGIVGPNTGYVLNDVRTVTLTSDTVFTPSAGPVVSMEIGSPLQAVADTQPSQTAQFVTLQAGSQAQLNPWAVSPFVLTGQYTYLARNVGRPDFMLTGGGQFSANTGTVNGSWTLQAFGQMSLGNVGVQLGPLDFVNPLVQVMLQGNQGQPASFGLAIGNQINLTLSTFTVNGIEQPQFAFFLNLQEVVNVGLNNGLCSAPATQGLLGLGWSFDPTKILP